MNNLNVISESGVIEAVSPLQSVCDELEAQVDRAVVDSDEVLSQAGDLKKIIKNQFNKIDDSRKAIVKPLNDHVKFINGQYKPYTNQLELIGKSLTVKMNAFATEQHRIREAEAKVQREAAEAEALERAQAAEARGDNEVAEKVLEQAASYEDTKTKSPIARGKLGSSTSTRKTIAFELTDIRALCKAIGDGSVSINAVTLNEKWVRSGIAQKKADEKSAELLESGYMPGVRFYEDITTVVR